MDNHPKWGNPQDNQIKASFSGDLEEEVTVSRVSLLGITLRKAGKRKVKKYSKLSTEAGDTVPDGLEAWRTFKHRCGLIRAISVLSGSKSTVTIYLDGFTNLIIDIEKTEFKFDPELEDGPVAEIIYEARCTRHGNTKGNQKYLLVSLIFTSQEQMKDFVIATTTMPDPQGPTSSSPRRSYGGGDDSSLLPVAAAFVIGSAISSD